MPSPLFLTVCALPSPLPSPFHCLIRSSKEESWNGPAHSGEEKITQTQGNWCLRVEETIEAHGKNIWKQFHQQSRSSFPREMTGRGTVEGEKSQLSLGCLLLVPRRLPLVPTARDSRSIAGTRIEYSNKSTRHIPPSLPLPTPSTYQPVPQTHGNPSQSAIDAPSHEVSRFSTWFSPTCYFYCPSIDLFWLVFDRFHCRFLQYRWTIFNQPTITSRFVN